MNQSELCPVCGYSLGFKAWDEGSASDEICPSCGIQFGYNDAVMDDEKKRDAIYQSWRTKWSEGGYMWSSRRPMPPNWNPQEQVKKVSNMQKITFDNFVDQLRKIVPDFADYHEASTLVDSPYMGMADFDALFVEKMEKLTLPSEQEEVRNVFTLINEAFAIEPEDERLTTLVHTTFLEQIAGRSKLDAVALRLLKGKALESFLKIKD